ncbi:MAG: PAS domain-containing protein [Planctomycetes bacterium]|nr:PAS domain-containing protein [Planctomycetota bacterium]
MALLTGAGLLTLGYLAAGVLEPLHRRAVSAVERERTAEERAERLQATCGEGVLLVDSEGLVLDWNPAAERIFGYPIHEVRGSKVAIVLAEVEAPEPAPGLSRETIGRRRDGVEVHLEIEVSERNEDGSCFLVVRDSGRLRSAEALARAAEDERRRVSAAALEAILVFDRDGRIQEANPAAERLIGKPWSQLSGRDLADTLLHRDQRQAFKRDLRDATTGGPDRVTGRGEVLELWITGRPAIRAHVSFARAGGRFFAFVLPEGAIGAHDAPSPSRNGPGSGPGLGPEGGGLHRRLLNEPG